jgi:hypothetical protein
MQVKKFSYQQKMLRSVFSIAAFAIFGGILLIKQILISAIFPEGIDLLGNLLIVCLPLLIITIMAAILIWPYRKLGIIAIADDNLSEFDEVETAAMNKFYRRSFTVTSAFLGAYIGLNYGSTAPVMISSYVIGIVICIFLICFMLAYMYALYKFQHQK